MAKNLQALPRRSLVSALDCHGLLTWRWRCSCTTPYCHRENTPPRPGPVGFFIGAPESYSSSHTAVMRQPMLAPAAFGGSVVAGIAAMLVSGYRIVDCFQYRTGPGACDQVISDNALPLVAGVAAIAGSFGGLWTYNPALRRKDDPEPELVPVAGRTESGPPPEPPIRPQRLADVEESLREAFRQAIANGDVEPAAGPVDDPDHEPPDERVAIAHELRAQGLTQQEIAHELGTSRSTVQRLLQQ